MLRKLIDSPWTYFGLAVLLVVLAVASQIRSVGEDAPMGTPADLEKLADRDDLNVMQHHDGKCPVPLHMLAVMFRARLPHESAEVEGFNSIIQKITGGQGGRTRLPTVSDRLRNKVVEAKTNAPD